MKSISWVPAAALLLGTTFLGSAGTTAGQSKATTATLQRMENEFMKASAEHGSQGYLSFYADDAVGVPNLGGIEHGKPEIAKQAGYLDDRNNHLHWTPLGADMAASGDLGYTYGTYEFHSLDKEGRATVSLGKYTTIWKLQKDGSWKVVLDMGNISPGPGNVGVPRRYPLI